ncbi:MAG: COX15/CtaA family protein [Cyanobacteria bacterium]|nr:COX15/CtaA family protein [Cyanobacteriota bacterium]
MRRLTSFQRLALWTTATTYLLILVGGLVRASGAGLGCPDWPRCFGSWIPPLSAANLPPQFDPSQFNPTLMWTEYLNRLLGVTVGFLIFATAISAWRNHRNQPRILWPTIAAFLLVGYEGWLGGRVVAHGLAPWIVTAHLIVAIVIVQLLLYATFEAFTGARAAHRASRLTVTIGILIVLTLVQAGFGTQVRSKIDQIPDTVITFDGAPLDDSWTDTIHRDLAGVVLIASLLITLWMQTQRSPILRWAFVTVGLAAAQIVVGVYMAAFGLSPPYQVAHLSLASLLLGAETVLWLLSRRQGA